MALKILHTSDWHLGRTLHEASLLGDQDHFLDWLLGHLSEGAYDAMILAGDVFDRSIPSEEALLRWDRFLVGFQEACPETVLCILAGNHDSATRITLGSKVIERMGVHLRGGSGRIEEPIVVKGKDGTTGHVWLLPFLWGGAISRESPEGTKVLHTQQDALEEAVRRVRQQMGKADVDVIAAHCFVSGSSVSESERKFVGTAMQVEPELFEGFTYVALGHLHRPQVLSPRLAYSGSPIAYSFSEAGQAKHLLSVSLEKGTEPVIESVPFVPARPMANLKGTMEDFLTSTEFDPWKEAYVRIQLTVKTDLLNPFMRLQARFPWLLEFQNGPVTTAGDASVAPEEAQTELDIGEEFLSFEARIRGEEAPEALVEAFETLRADAERKAAR